MIIKYNLTSFDKTVFDKLRGHITISFANDNHELPDDQIKREVSYAMITAYQYLNSQAYQYLNSQDSYFENLLVIYANEVFIGMTFDPEKDSWKLDFLDKLKKHIVFA